MVLCLVALPVLALLGLFSAKYRTLAKESFRCVFTTLTFRACDASVDTRIRAQITADLAKTSKPLARFTRKYFTLLSYAFVILTVLTVGYVGYAGTQYYLWGSCYGPDASGFCVFDPTGSNVAFSSVEVMPSCAETTPTAQEIAAIIADDLPVTLADTSPVVFVGCFGCEFTREAYPIVREVAAEADRGFVFAHLPVHQHDIVASLYNECVYEQLGNESFAFIDEVFAIEDTSLLTDAEFLLDVATRAGASEEELLACVDSPEAAARVRLLTLRLAEAGIYGTPTVYIDDRVLVGPKPKRVFSRLIN